MASENTKSGSFQQLDSNTVRTTDSGESGESADHDAMMGGSQRSDMVNKRVLRSDGPVEIQDWGYPGFLTDSEFSIYESFRKEVNSRSGDFRSTLFSFEKAGEEEAYALCRWLRARKFNLKETIQMVEEAIDCSSTPRKHDFYPCPKKALNVEASLYLKQYPNVSLGYARNGCPVFYSKPGVLNVNAIECLTTPHGVINFHWNAMMHEYVANLNGQRERSNGKFKRYECVCVLDLKHLTTAQLSKRPLNIIKAQSEIDSLCFPETLNKMIIINAPGFFSLTWKVLKTWVDQRTSNKVEVLGTNKDKLLKKLTEIIDIDSLPSDYGGNGPSVDDAIENTMMQQHSQTSSDDGLKLLDQKTYVMKVQGKGEKSIYVPSGRVLKLSLFTRSKTGGVLSIRTSSGQFIPSLPKGGIAIQHQGIGDDEEEPTRYNLEDSGITLSEEGTYTIEIDSNGSRFSTSLYCLAIIEFSLEAHRIGDISTVAEKQEDKSQAGSDISPAVLSAKSLFVGTLKLDDGTILMRPSPKIRKKKSPNSGGFCTDIGFSNNVTGLPPKVERIHSTVGKNTTDFAIAPASPQQRTGAGRDLFSGYCG